MRCSREHLIENQEQIYQKLEEYLEQQDWREADYETAFIVYQWMVIENYDDFDDLFRDVSLEVIDEIDRLWMDYSEGKFGIKGQAKIYRDLGGTVNINGKVWELFSDRVGWQERGSWLTLKEIPYYATTQPDSIFPMLMYSRDGCDSDATIFMEGWGFLWMGFLCFAEVGRLFSRVKT